MPDFSTSFLTSQILCNAISKWPDAVSTGIVLAQMCDTTQSLASAALRSISSRSIIKAIPDGPDNVSIGQMIAKANTIAETLGDNTITPEHILLAMISLEDSHAHRSLLKCNQSIKNIEICLMDLMDLSEVLYVYKDDNGFLLSHWELWRNGIAASVSWEVSCENSWLCARSVDVDVHLNCSSGQKSSIQGLVLNGKKILKVSVHRKSIKIAKTAVVSFLYGVLLK